jgi:hypothetical protein
MTHSQITFASECAHAKNMPLTLQLGIYTVLVTTNAVTKLASLPKQK